jgi:hypothetical protein
VDVQINTAREKVEGHKAECYGEIDRLEKVWEKLRI